MLQIRQASPSALVLAFVNAKTALTHKPEAGVPKR